MIPRSVNAPTVPVPFHKLLKVVAVVDRSDAQTTQLLDQIAAEGFDIEIADSFERDLSEDAAVGAYIASIDGDRIESARQAAQSIRALGFGMPLWALADSHRISDIQTLGLVGEVEGYVYLGQQTPAFYAKQVVASIIKYGKTLLPPFFGGLMAYDSEVPWEDLPTEVIKREQQCWSFHPRAKWHGYAGYADGYAMVDPNKLTLLTPGIDRRTGEYLGFGVPATVVANYLREERVVPEKCELRGAGRVRGARAGPHQVLHLRRPRVGRGGARAPRTNP